MTASAPATASRYFSGVACTCGYILIASTQSVALNVLLATANVFLIVGIGFVVATMCFLVGGVITGGSRAYRFVAGRPGLVLALNVTSVFNWLFYFLAVKYLEPAVAVTLTQGIGPLSMLAVDLVRRRRVSRLTLACQAVVLLAATALCVRVLVGQPDPAARVQLAIGIAIAVVCSVSITATLVLAKDFAEAGIPATVVLSVRFPLLVLTCAAFLSTEATTVHIDLPTVLIAVAIGLVGVSTAAYLLQRGVELAPGLAVSTCLALSPLVVWGIGALRHDADLDPVVLALITAIVVTSLVSILYNGVRRRSPAATP